MKKEDIIFYSILAFVTLLLCFFSVKGGINKERNNQEVRECVEKGRDVATCSYLIRGYY